MGYIEREWQKTRWMDCVKESSFFHVWMCKKGMSVEETSNGKNGITWHIAQTPNNGRKARRRRIYSYDVFLGCKNQTAIAPR